MNLSISSAPPIDVGFCVSLYLCNHLCSGHCWAYCCIPFDTIGTINESSFETNQSVCRHQGKAFRWNYGQVGLRRVQSSWQSTGRSIEGKKVGHQWKEWRSIVNLLITLYLTITNACWRKHWLCLSFAPCRLVALRVEYADKRAVQQNGKNELVDWILFKISSCESDQDIRRQKKLPSHIIHANYNWTSESSSGSHSHLTSLASEASHSLLSPLGTHATIDGDVQHDGVTVKQIKIALSQRGWVLRDSLKVSGKELDILDGGLQVLQGGALLHGHHKGVFQWSDKDLHFCWRIDFPGCSKPYRWADSKVAKIKNNLSKEFNSEFKPELGGPSFLGVMFSWWGQFPYPEQTQCPAAVFQPQRP